MTIKGPFDYILKKNVVFFRLLSIIENKHISGGLIGVLHAKIIHNFSI